MLLFIVFVADKMYMYICTYCNAPWFQIDLLCTKCRFI